MVNLRKLPPNPAYKIQQVFNFSFEAYASGHSLTNVQEKAARAIMGCKTGALGYNFRVCDECGYTEFRANSCRNRNCPNCQGIQKEIWVDKRSSEVIDCPYFHVVFTLPHELNPLIYSNQKLLYELLHKSSSDTLLELSADKKYLGAVPGIIQVLHTWNQEMGYHVHMHCIISGGGLTPERKLRTSGKDFFIPVRVLRDKFKGKYLACLDALYECGKLAFPESCAKLRNTYEWKEFKDSLYEKDWCPYIKETFNGFGNAIEYLGRYTNRIAISNSRILSVTETETVFTARGRKPGSLPRRITLSNEEFIRRYLMHVLPKGFQKIRYYGFLNNRTRAKNLKLIFKLQGHQSFKSRYAGKTMQEILEAILGIDTSFCPECGCCGSMKPSGRIYGSS